MKPNKNIDALLRDFETWLRNTDKNEEFYRWKN